MDRMVYASELSIVEDWLLLLRSAVAIVGPRNLHVELLSPTQRVLNLAQPS